MLVDQDCRCFLCSSANARDPSFPYHMVWNEAARALEIPIGVALVIRCDNDDWYRPGWREIAEACGVIRGEANSNGL